MAVIKCKMCGGDMEISADKTFGICEYCGSTMTLPKVSDDQRAAAFNRGNHFRRAGEFDKALGVYERIVAEDDTDAEAHWCCALCRFGIEYVEDPATYEWLPTCHRASFDSFLEDVDYLAALEHSDGITRRQYQKDAAKIAEVQRGILATSQNTEPYDVFISYKELDENGERTRDSVLAQDIYYQLTEQGRRVFFSRISLEDIPGTQYEPYIFAALNSAKVMIVVGTSAENLNAAQADGADLVFLPIYYQPASVIFSQAKAMGYEPTFFGVDGMDGILTLEGFDTSLAEDVMVLTPFSADAQDEQTQSFVAKYTEKYGEVPNQFAADEYDVIYALKAALEAANCTPDMSNEEICDALVSAFQSLTFDGLTGKGMTWNTEGEVSKMPAAVIIKNGTYVSAELEAAEEAPAEETEAAAEPEATAEAEAAAEPEASPAA